LIDKLSTKIDASNEEMKVSMRSLFNVEANVQRVAITKQANRVTKLESMLTAMMGEMKAIKGDNGEDEPAILKMLEYENVPDVEPEDMMEQAIQASARRSTFFELPENKGKHDKYQKDLRHIHAMESWKGKEDFRDWLTAAVAWVGHVDLSVMDHTEVKFALWRGVPDEKRRLADVLKPGSKAWMHDNLKEYTRRLLDTFQPPRYTEVWKQKYTARVHKVGEPVECYLADKMRLFRSSHNPYDFKRFLETGLQSICHPKLQQHVVSPPRRTRPYQHAGRHHGAPLDERLLRKLSRSHWSAQDGGRRCTSHHGALDVSTRRSQRPRELFQLSATRTHQEPVYQSESYGPDKSAPSSEHDSGRSRNVEMFQV